MEKEIPIYYGNFKVGFHKLDILVEGLVIVELKTVDALGAAQYAQIKSYLKAANLKIGLLANFAKERADFRRVAFPHYHSFPPFH
jgi:GxxExxY protein